MKRNKYEYDVEDWIKCPMGTLVDDGIECYYFGLLEVKDCNRCEHHK